MSKIVGKYCITDRKQLKRQIKHTQRHTQYIYTYIYKNQSNNE